jgi:signal transduction histidine kinase
VTAGRRLRPAGQAAAAYAAGLVTFSAVAVVLAVAGSALVAVAIGGFCLGAVLATFRSWGAAFGVPVAMSAMLAYDWFQLPPTHAHAFPDATDVADLLVYVAVAVLAGQLAGRAVRQAERAERARRALADEQAALRRVATLVARNAEPPDVFAAIACETGRLLGVDATHLGRYGPGRTVVGVGSWSRDGDHLPVGTTSAVDGRNVTADVLHTGRPARMGDYHDATGAVAELLRGRSVRSSVGTPIVVGDRLWGVMIASSKEERPLPRETEVRMAGFAELAATAISNTEATAAVARHNAERRAAVAASRARIVAAADAERRRVVQDLHDGAQQRLVHTVVTLKLARRAIAGEPDGGAQGLLDQALSQAQDAMVELRELAHGILPSVLTRGGLRAGVDVLASRMPVPVVTDVTVDRLPAPVEATAYFVVAEALTNVAKHARASQVTVAARVEDGMLRLAVHDDGVGGARADGSGLVGLGDRLAVLDGALRVESRAARGTLVAATIPLSR